MSVPVHRPDRRPRFTLPRLVALTAGLVFAAGTIGATPPLPESLHIPGAPPGVGLSAPRADAARLAAVAEPALLGALGAGRRQDFFITLGERADLKAAHAMNWRDRGRYVYKTLRDTADRSQAKLRTALAAQGAQFQPYWIMNGILVRDGDLATLARAAAFAEVARIAPLPRSVPIKPEKRAAAGAAPADGITDNLRWIGADRVWAQGTTGNGVTVGVIDTGAAHRHEALRQQYRGYRDRGLSNDYNWFDPETRQSTPRYTDEHGSHVTGIIAGDNRNPDPARRERIGVAPGARWISCVALGTESDLPSYVPDCMQFMLAPTRTDGTLPDPDRRPDIVNNSWISGGTCDGQGTSPLQDAVEAWVAAGVLPVFAAGNTMNCDLPAPPGLSTVAAPASLAASFAVGSSGNHNGQYASHSLWGPTAAVSTGLPGLPDPRGFPQMKPQVVAPGVAIRSVVSDENQYVNMTGTSMSAPHVAGVFALMIEAGECLRGDYATLGTLLMRTARPIAYDSGGDPAPGIGNVPNYATGWGEIDAPAAVDAAANACGPQGFLRGRITGSDGRPLAGARVDLIDANARVYDLTTDVDGSYIRRVPQLLAGGYTVRVSAFGYLPDSESGVQVANGATTTHDVVLAAAPMHKVAGRVTDAATGWPLHARIAIAGYPGEPVWTDPVTGVYAIRLPEGTAYRFDLTSDIPGYEPAWRDIPDASAANQDFALHADMIACKAPGYAYARRVLDETFENNGAAPPAGWSATSAHGIGWRFGTSADIDGEIYAVPEHGRYAANNEEHGADHGMDNDASADHLTLPALNLVGATNPALRFAYVLPGNVFTTVSVQGSTDGGATWMPLGNVADTARRPRWTEGLVSLAPIAGAANARVRFFYSDGTSAAYPRLLGSVFAVDDVEVRANCTVPARGGLVVGHVRDANSGIALDGAYVSADGGVATTSFTSADPNVGTGFFATYSAGATAALAAVRGRLPAGYGDAAATAAVADRGTVAAELRLPAGRLRLYPPAGPRANVTLGSTATVPFTVHNSGTAPLDVAFERAAVEEHYDGAFPPPGWTVHDADASKCGWKRLSPTEFPNYAGGDGAAAYVEGFPCFASTKPIDSSLVSPRIDLSASRSASLGFFVAFSPGGNDAPRLDIDVSVDAGTTWSTIRSLTEPASPYGPGALLEFDLGAYVGRSDVRVRLRFRSTPPNSYVVVDQLHVFDGAGMHDWLDLAPDYAALAPGASRELQATLDARRIAQPGVYSVPLRIAENTPYEWPFDGTVAATLNVTAPANYGWFGGTVRGLGACDIAPTTLPGATVRIRNASGDTFETTADADGKYRYWLPATAGAYTLTAHAAGHRDADPQTLSLAAGAETTANLDLRAQLPCLLTDPAHITASVAPGQSTSVPFRLMNGGAAGTIWTLTAGGDPAERIPLPVSQTTSLDPEENMWTGCVNGDGYTLENHYLRKFPLRDLADPSEIVAVAGIEFAIDKAASADGQQSVHAKLYALRGDGAMRYANLQLLREKTVTVADTRLDRVRATFDEPVRIGRDAVLVASVHAPSGTLLGNTFGLGFNTAGQTAEAYLAMPGCDTPEPTPLTQIDPRLGGVHMLIELAVLGSAPCHERATPVPWLAAPTTSGALPPGGGFDMSVHVRSSTLTAGTYGAAMCLGDAGGGAPTPVPVTLNVGAADTLFKNGFD